METKQINDLINSVISSEEFKVSQEDIAKEILKNLKDFPFESDDDVRLAVIRIKEVFIAGLNYQVSKNMISLMGIEEK